MAAAPPLTITVPDGGIGRASIDCTTPDVGVLHTVRFEVKRSWVDILIGSEAGKGEISRARWGTDRLRLQPGFHVLSFTPTAGAFAITFERSAFGYTAILGLWWMAGGDLVLETPYFDYQLRSLRSDQSRSVRWLWHNQVSPRALVRYSNDSWGFIEWRSDDGPFLDGDPSVTIGFAARTGSTTCTSTRGFFQPEHVGALLRATHAGQVASRTISGEDQWTDPIRVTGITAQNNNKTASTRRFAIHVDKHSGGSTVMLQRSVGVDYDWTDVAEYPDNTNENYDDELDNAVIFYRIGVPAGGFAANVDVSLIYGSGETTGVARIISYTDEKHVGVDVVTPFASTKQTRVWDEGAWSPLRGYPAAGTIFDGRLWQASLLSIWATRSDRYDSNLLGDKDADAISRVLGVGDASPIRWLKGSLRLQLGTDADVADIDAVLIGDPSTVQIRSTALDEPITPANINVREQAAKIVFIDATRWRLRRVSFDVETSGFITEDLTRLHNEIAFLHGGFVDLAAQERPMTRLWTPTGDGQLPVLTLSEADQIVGWSRIVLDGEVLSVTCTSGVFTSEYDEDFTHIVVERELDGVTRRMHERVASERWVDAADACYLEQAVRYEGPPASIITGLDHLLGCEVLVWDGAQYGPYTVGQVDEDGGVGIDMSADGVEVTDAVIGREMVTRYMSGRLPYGAAQGTGVGVKKEFDHATLLFYRTALGGVQVAIGDGNLGEAAFDHDQTLWARILDLAEDFTTDDPAALYTGEIRIPLDAGNLRDPRVLVKFDGAAPATLLGFAIDMEANE